MTTEDFNTIEIIDSIPWEANEDVRVLWYQVTIGARSDIAEQIRRDDNEHVIFPIILRDILFTNANAILSDLNRLLANSEEELTSIKPKYLSKISIIILSKEAFTLPLVSSPITLPTWFPFLGGKEIHLKISDLFQTAQLELLSGTSARIGQLASELYDLESAMVNRLAIIAETHPQSLQSIIDTLYSEEKPSPLKATENFLKHINSINNPRAYRPTAKTPNSFLSKIICLALKSSPDTLATHSKKIAKAFGDSHSSFLKPTIFAIILRPTCPLTTTERNWHSAMLAIYQAYQLMNAAAHAGDYPSYPATLILSTAKDLARFLIEANIFIASIFVAESLLET